MELEFLGVGEDCDPHRASVSFLIREKTTLLVDCGLGTPQRLFQKYLPPESIDAVYLTHFHAGHFFGLPAFLVDRHVLGRKGALTVIGQPGTKERVLQLCELAYNGMPEWLGFPLEFLETIEPAHYREFDLAFAPTDHHLNMAIRVTAGGVSLGISGDGNFTEASSKLFASCDVVVHEAYKAVEDYPFHTTVKRLIEEANGWPKLRHLALVHLEREDREKRFEEFAQFLKHDRYKVTIPGDGDLVTI